MDAKPHAATERVAMTSIAASVPPFSRVMMARTLSSIGAPWECRIWAWMGALTQLRNLTCRSASSIRGIHRRSSPTARGIPPRSIAPSRVYCNSSRMKCCEADSRDLSHDLIADRATTNLMLDEECALNVSNRSSHLRPVSQSDAHGVTNDHRVNGLLGSIGQSMLPSQSNGEPEYNPDTPTISECFATRTRHETKYTGSEPDHHADHVLLSFRARMTGALGACADMHPHFTEGVSCKARVVPREFGCISVET